MVIKKRAIDLFAGVGGIRLGFEKAGFKTVFSNDFEKSCKDTFDLNHKGVKLTIADICKYPIKDIPNFEILLAGFPCQPFSIAGQRQGFKDKKGRGNLFFRIAEIIEEKKPKIVFLENVKNIKTHDHGKTFKVIKKTLEDLGYMVKSEVLNGMTHGNLPQNRERIIIVGFLDHKKAKKFKFPKTTKLNKSFKDFLEKNVDEKYYYKGKFIYPELKKEITSKDTVYQWRRKYVRENKSKVCPTLTANMGSGGHNVPIILDHKGIRKLTPFECFRLQGFPKSWKLPKIADAKLYHQAGNSVNVTVIQRVAKEIVKVL
ncbi:MAG: DNA (cytosine-5-)-methyltransferase [Nanoarchaeota archaeon]